VISIRRRCGANSSGTNDGAALMVVTSASKADELGLAVAGRLAAVAVAAVGSGEAGTGMIPASPTHCGRPAHLATYGTAASKNYQHTVTPNGSPASSSASSAEPSTTRTATIPALLQHRGRGCGHGGGQLVGSGETGASQKVVGTR